MGGENLILFLMIFSQIISPAKSMSTAWLNIQKGMASVDRVDELLLADDKIEEKANAVRATGFNDSIEFRNVFFKYEKEPVLKGISFSIKKGQMVALVGKSGSGKSTMVDLLPRFMDVTSGEILIDGVQVSDYELKSLRSPMGMVSQQSILFNDTFRNNIAFGSQKNVSVDRIISAAKVANAHAFIMENENDYEQGVGEGGGKLNLYMVITNA